MCDQLKNCDWQLFSLFAEDQAEADFQHTRGIYAIYGPNLDLIFFLLLVLVAESDLGKGSNFCHRFLLTSIIYQNKHTDWSYRKCKSQKGKSGMKDTVFENHSKSLIFQHLWICKRPKLQPTYNFQFEFSRQTSIMTNICRWYFGIFGLKIQTSVARFDGM